jgi:ferredoxin
MRQNYHPDSPCGLLQPSGSMAIPMIIEDVLAAIKGAEFTPRGVFHPQRGDKVPEVAPGISTSTLVLVGNAGPSMWTRFSRERDPELDSLDDWSLDRLNRMAAGLGARALFPFTKPPLPFQRWAIQAEGCHPSPIGLFIHPDYGLWHAYRGALAFAERMALPEAPHHSSPCTACHDRPCLSTCPVDAFDGKTYDVASCAHHLSMPAGEGCMKRGCRARHACPVGRTYAYEPAQARFHMRAFLRARRAEGIA